MLVTRVKSMDRHFICKAVYFAQMKINSLIKMLTIIQHLKSHHKFFNLFLNFTTKLLLSLKMYSRPKDPHLLLLLLLQHNKKNSSAFRRGAVGNVNRSG